MLGSMDDSVTTSFETVQPGEHMNPDQFSDQAAAGQGVFGSPGLARRQQQYDARVPRKLLPSVSSNGINPDQYQSTLGGVFPTQNGIAKNMYEVWKYTEQKGM